MNHFLVTVIVVVLCSYGPADSNKPTVCSAPEYHQFDFWLGDWDAFETDNPRPVARARIDAVLDGCVVHENYRGKDGHEGESFSIYDASRKVWHQSWVTNGGLLLVIEGEFRNGEMVLSGTDHSRQDMLVQGSWRAIAGGVRETAITSNDNGRSWKPWFDITFRPHRD